MFVFFTIVGTVTHELGHIAVAEILGNETKLFYGSMTSAPKGYWEDEDVIVFQEYVENNRELLEENPKKGEKLLEPYWKPIEEKYPQDPEKSILITVGGPVQTMLTSFLGLLILYFRKSKSKINFKFTDWLGVFLSLFALREVFNGLLGLIGKFLIGAKYHSGDEYAISSYLNLSVWTIPMIAMVIGVFIALYVIFKVIPIRYRFSFILAGFIGGLSGFIIWFEFLGPLVLPYY